VFPKLSKLQAEGLVSITRLGCLQPDFLSFSSVNKRISILDLCCPSDVYADQLFTADNRKRTSYTPLSNALHYYEAAGWEIRIFPVAIGIRGLMDIRHIREAFRFLSILRKEWYIGIERFAIASVQAFTFLHPIRFSSSPLVPGIASRDGMYLSDPGNDSENMATSQSEDSADDHMLDPISRIRKHAHAHTISSETNAASSKKNARTCPAP
jgi:hypothetical protein